MAMFLCKEQVDSLNIYKWVAIVDNTLKYMSFTLIFSMLFVWNLKWGVGIYL